MFLTVCCTADVHKKITCKTNIPQRHNTTHGALFFSINNYNTHFYETMFDVGRTYNSGKHHDIYDNSPEITRLSQ